MDIYPTGDFAVFSFAKDGATNKKLGDYSGSVLDIAVNLYDLCDWSLQFYTEGSLKASMGKQRIFDIIEKNKE